MNPLCNFWSTSRLTCGVKYPRNQENERDSQWPLLNDAFSLCIRPQRIYLSSDESTITFENRNCFPIAFRIKIKDSENLRVKPSKGYILAHDKVIVSVGRTSLSGFQGNEELLALFSKCSFDNKDVPKVYILRNNADETELEPCRSSRTFVKGRSHKAFENVGHTTTLAHNNNDIIYVDRRNEKHLIILLFLLILLLLSLGICLLFLMIHNFNRVFDKTISCYFPSCIFDYLFANECQN